MVKSAVYASQTDQPIPGYPAQPGLTGRLANRWQAVKATFDPRNPTMRYALRLAIAVLVAMIVCEHVLSLPYAYAVPMTVVMVLKPDFGTTLTGSMQRMLTTAFGAVAASALASVLTDQAILTAIVFCAAVIAMAVSKVNSWLFAGTLSFCVFVMLESIATGSDLVMFEDRIMDVAIGVVIAIATGLLLFPVRQRNILPGRIAKTLEAMADYLQTFGQRGTSAHEQSLAAGRMLYRCMQATNTVYQQFLNEPKHYRGSVEGWQVIVVATQQLFDAVTALSYVHLFEIGPATRAQLIAAETQLVDQLRIVAGQVASATPIAQAKPPSAVPQLNLDRNNILEPLFESLNDYRNENLPARDRGAIQRTCDELDRCLSTIQFITEQLDLLSPTAVLVRPKT